MDYITKIVSISRQNLKKMIIYVVLMQSLYQFSLKKAIIMIKNIVQMISYIV